MQWNRLPQSSAPGQNSEQDAAIVTWYGILRDAGLPIVERAEDCYRAAQDRKRQLMAKGKPQTVVTPNDLVVEWELLRQMHAEIDGVRLLPGNAAGACVRCLGTGMERMPDGTYRPGCLHEEVAEAGPADADFVLETAAMMREALKRIGSPKPPPPEPKPAPRIFACEECGRRVSSEHGWREGEMCNVMIPGPAYNGARLVCEGLVK